MGFSPLISGLNLGVIGNGWFCFNYHQRNNRYICIHCQQQDNFCYLLWWQPHLNLWGIPFHVLHPGGNSKANTGKIVCMLFRHWVNHRTAFPLEVMREPNATSLNTRVITRFSSGKGSLTLMRHIMFTSSRVPDVLFDNKIGGSSWHLWISWGTCETCVWGVTIFSCILIQIHEDFAVTTALRWDDMWSSACRRWKSSLCRLCRSVVYRSTLCNWYMQHNQEFHTRVQYMCK